jgi:NhaA family Na+:H+ antiporter
LLLAFTLIALLIANSPLSDIYVSLRDFKIGFDFLHLNLSLGSWATDGLLAVFFFVAGMELKHELTQGSLKELRQAVVPVAAAIGGMAIPAVIYLLINSRADGDTSGWAIPMATDIAFALGVLSIVGRGLPVALRAFLLTLAVVDDLGAITIIALFFTSSLNFVYLALGISGIALFALAQHKQWDRWFVVVPLAVLTWALFHASGVHATVAAIAMGLLVPTVTKSSMQTSVAARYEKFLLPLSAGICLPLFAFFATGVSLQGFAPETILNSPISMGIILGLFIGKPLGILLGAAIATKLTSAHLNPDLTWRHISGVGVLSGVGFTVSLLISKLAFEGDTKLSELSVIAILVASSFAVLVSTFLLRRTAKR